ncbi:TonB-dependent receptor [Mucilaginibacter jinjuensis]|uniref:Carboxypeptidase-like regulatory domain-containing protein n=1 Tax=Mucilaginibacter jinjuensis TaxID=1176721 RepID=A0ABY7T747_9SPHI|nr:TonB-dependent receptor [Mucilaginibacter jinjuensis]WCT12094.1 carboxypeptidase-like regulatory domain-containing protein [Mucilaginibacter jinjuensis]
MKKIYLSLLYLLFSCTLLMAQSTKPISVDFKQATIDEVAADLQAKTGLHFYYDAAQFDSLRVTLQLADKPLATILTLAFANTNYHFAISNEHDVFLTRERQLQPQLAAGFYNKATTANGGAAAVAITDYTADIAEKKVTEATTENKLYEVGIKTNNIKGGSVTLAGYIRDIKTGEAVIGASVMIAGSKNGIATNQFGYYSIVLPRGRNIINIKALGMSDTHRQVVMYSNGSLNIDVREQVTTLKEVKVSADKVANVRSVELGATRLDIKSIKQVPAVFGEADVLRIVLTLPGVTSVGEATTGFNVRGGAADQNLILLNESTVYNPAHFFGFFSAFNPDIVKDIELYKSSIPENYGGRLSSVLQVTDREGNKKKFTGSAGIGLLTSRLNVEGPIDKDKTSFIFGGRTTYSDWLLHLLPDAYKHSSASFYDLNLGISHQIDEKNNLYFTGYMSHDAFKLNSDTTYSYSNKNAAIKWKHTYSNKLFSLISTGVDDYQYSVSSDANPVDGYKLNFDIRQIYLKTDFTYYLSRKHTLDFGLSSLLYHVEGGNYTPEGSGSLVVPQMLEPEHALESALYLGDKFDVTNRLSFTAGIRYSLYNYLGPHTVYDYAPGQPKTENTLIDSTAYGKGKNIKTYGGPEIRLSGRYNFTDDFSVKAGYNTLRQYIHLLSNTTAISPTDVYKLSDPNIKPQYGDQVSLGLYKNFKSNTIETSVEVYYKRLRDYLDYKSGAVLVMNPHIETDVLNTQGKAYGIEFLIRKNVGKLNGWTSYTYSRTFLRQDDPNAGELINEGNYYPANYDKPHNFNFTGNYRFTHRYSMSLNLVYSTGRPITLPIAKYEYAGAERVYYSDRNEYRIPDYFRSDFSINIEGNHRVHQLTHNSWTIGVYNLTGRKNAYSTYFTSSGGTINGYQLSIFATAIPFINYNIRF